MISLPRDPGVRFAVIQVTKWIGVVCMIQYALYRRSFFLVIFISIIFILHFFLICILYIYTPNGFFINSIYMNRCCVVLGPATTATISYTKNLRLVAQLTQEAVQKSSTGMEAVLRGEMLENHQSFGGMSNEWKRKGGTYQNNTSTSNETKHFLRFLGFGVMIKLQMILLMVQKSGKLTSGGKGS